MDPDSGSNGELVYSYVVKGNEEQLFDVRPLAGGGAEVFALFDFDRENPAFGFRRAGSKIVYPVTVKVSAGCRVPFGCIFGITRKLGAQIDNERCCGSSKWQGENSNLAQQIKKRRIHAVNQKTWFVLINTKRQTILL